MAFSLESMWRRLVLSMARGVIQLVNDEGGLQLVQVKALDGETISDIERIQEYGFTSHPPKGSQAFLCFLAGERTTGFVLGCEDPDVRPAVEEGESAQYGPNGKDQWILCDKDGNITIRTSGTLTLQAADLKMLPFT